MLNPLEEQINQLILQYIDPQDIIRKYDKAKSERMPWDTKWQQIQDQVFPDYRDYVNQSKHKNQPQSGKIKDHAGIISGKINKIVSILSSQLSDPSVKWLDLKFGDSGMNNMEATRNWLYGCKEELYNLFGDPTSNFYPSTFSFHSDWFTLGTACREIILRKDNNKIYFNTVSMQSICAEQSGYGDLSTIYRTFSLSPQQAYDLWGDMIHPSQLRLVQEGKGNLGTVKKFDYIEVSMPNPIFGMELPIPPLKYLTCVIDKTNKTVVDIGQHHQSPYVVSRFIVSPGELYGRSYVWYAMPDMIAINRTSKRILQGIDYAIFPVNLVKDETSITQSQITPGAFVQGLDYNGNPTIRQLPPLANTQMAMEFLNYKSNELDDILVARDIFPSDAPNMTATEVNERKIQANNRIRPLLVRLEAEDLNNTVRRSLSLLEQQGKLPQFPYEKLQISPEQLPNPLEILSVQFSGQMARMQKLQEIVNSDALFQKVLQAAQVDQSVLDRINLDAFIVEDAKIYGISPSLLNDEQTVQSIRESRAQSEQAQAAAQQESMAVDNLVKLKEAGIAPQQLATI